MEAENDLELQGYPPTTARKFGIRTQTSSNQPPHDEINTDSKARETTAWEVYNKRALIVDRELIKDWNDTLNTLLIFVRICLITYFLPTARYSRATSKGDRD